MKIQRKKVQLLMSLNNPGTLIGLVEARAQKMESGDTGSALGEFLKGPSQYILWISPLKKKCSAHVRLCSMCASRLFFPVSGDAYYVHTIPDGVSTSFLSQENGTSSWFKLHHFKKTHPNKPFFHFMRDFDFVSLSLAEK